MKIALSFTVLFVGVLSLQGCTFFTSPKEQPIIEDKIGEFGSSDDIGTLATTADRRLVIFDRKSHAYCAEPSPDAADNLVSAFSGALEGSGGDVTAKVEMAKSFASTVKQLFIRTQGLQLYRDGMYSLCQDYVKGAVTPAEYKIRQEKLLEVSETLIKQEIPELRYLRSDSTVLPKLENTANQTQSEASTK